MAQTTIAGAMVWDGDCDAACPATAGMSLMGRSDDLGQVREGLPAAPLLVTGDVTADVGLLQHQGNPAMIMKDGVLLRDPRAGVQAGGLIRAAE